MCEVTSAGIITGTSRPSILRSAGKLGFDGFTSLQGWVRQDVAKRLSSPSQRI